MKLMHSCSQDLEIFHLLFDEIPPNIFDTQVAAAFLGKGDQVSYAALVEDICGVTLHKAHTRARWCNRPLSKEEILYAEDDVRYLSALQDSLTAELEKLGRKEWFDAEMQVITNTTVFAINDSKCLAANECPATNGWSAAWRQPRHWLAGARAWRRHATNQEAGYWQTRCW